MHFWDILVVLAYKIFDLKGHSDRQILNADLQSIVDAFCGIHLRVKVPFYAIGCGYNRVKIPLHFMDIGYNADSMPIYRCCAATL